MTKESTIAKEEPKALIQFRGEPITLTFDDVKRFICPLGDAKEIGLFLRTCQVLQLNPFANEIFLIKYSPTEKASMVISIESYLKAAEANPNYDGHEAGVILRDSGGKLEFRQGAFVLDEERGNLVGGWARVYRKDRSHPYYVSVHKSECVKHRKDGSVTEFWQESKQPWMLRKVALSRALVEAFSSLFAGLVSNAEYEEFPKEVITKLPQPRGESEEGEVPLAFIKNGQPDWDLFWVRQKEKGVDGKRAHQLLKVESIKTDLIDKGKTLEEIHDMITKALEEQGVSGAYNSAELEPVPEDELQAYNEQAEAYIGQDELFSQELPVLNQELAKGWQIVKNAVKTLNLSGLQIQNWFKHYDIEVKLSDFDQELPPAGITNELLSKFQSGLDAYQGKLLK